MDVIKDRNATEIKPGNKLRRVVDGKAVGAGHEYVVVKRSFSTGGEGDDLVAEGGFISELLWPERAKEFVVIE